MGFFFFGGVPGVPPERVLSVLGGIGAGRLAAGLVELAVDGPARLVWLVSQYSVSLR